MQPPNQQPCITLPLTWNAQAEAVRATVQPPKPANTIMFISGSTASEDPLASSRNALVQATNTARAPASTSPWKEHRRMPAATGARHGLWGRMENTARACVPMRHDGEHTGKLWEEASTFLCPTSPPPYLQLYYILPHYWCHTLRLEGPWTRGWAP